MKIGQFAEFVNEGIYDKGILFAFFMAGGPGSGKSYVSSKLFGFDQNSSITVSSETGLKLINSDVAFEILLKLNGYDVSSLADIKKNPEEWDKIMSIRNKGKSLTELRYLNYLNGRLGVVIDGTGRDYNKIKIVKTLLDSLGYDTYMIFVNTTLDTAI